MIIKSGVLVAAIFAILGLLHIYWAMGGNFGSEVGVPTIEGKRAFEPTVTATLLVATALFIAMLVVLGQIGFLGKSIPPWIFRVGTFGISLVFLLRTIGNFKTVGFFKQIHDTPFAYWDTWLFSPLCLVIAVMTFLVAYQES
jgi:Protein of unknown function (DUF3995)